VHLAGLATGNTATVPGQGAPEPVNSTPNPAAKARSERIRIKELHGRDVYGGTEPFSVNLCDFRVSFPSTLDTTDWDTGKPAVVPATIDVHSRPSVLYRQLFGPSLGGIVTNFIRDGLIVLCVVFFFIEALALWMATRLSSSITTSVQELYAATQRVDRGDFMHRIAATQTGQQDQLGELSRSFNRMTGSLERLMVEQHEKERLQSELNIAQEVQANLFPQHVHNLPKLEMHGICRPARSVSGDYYDFLVFHHPDNPDHTPGREAGVGIAIGDISGKGISAALLMATLHSAVRAYLLASEELVYSDSALAGLSASREAGAGDGGELFESPGRILSMLNRHLYRTTQRAKYATLFLTHYNADTAQLTYSNAGHLPPLVLGLDGKIRRLDRGGTVVGLMDGMRYDEGRIQMHPGDILVGYSDGITEPENDFGEFGEERFMEVVARYRDQPLHVISAQVMLALDAWIGAEEQPDDITLVLARQL
jgi:sigma-B regulation protein RsbU (phosphoserine phosphatase)